MTSLDQWKKDFLTTKEGIDKFTNKLKEKLPNLSDDKIKKIIEAEINKNKFVDEDFAKWASNHNKKWNDSNIFADSSVTSLSNCCRLKSNIESLGYFNSIGASGLKVGSVKVSTINLARIAYESENNESKFISILTDRLVIDMKILDVVRDIIKRNVEKGLLPNFQEGLLDFDHLYNTIGINGIYEVMKSFGYTYKDEFDNTYYTEEAMKFGKKIFDTIHKTIAEFVVDKDYKVNVEQIPGETAAVKFMQADNLLFGKMTCCQGLKTNKLFINFTLNNEEYSIPSDYKFTLSGGSKETIENIIANNLDLDDKELVKFKV